MPKYDVKCLDGALRSAILHDLQLTSWLLRCLCDVSICDTIPRVVSDHRQLLKYTVTRGENAKDQSEPEGG
jgi:hypothetical protein